MVTFIVRLFRYSYNALGFYVPKAVMDFHRLEPSGALSGEWMALRRTDGHTGKTFGVLETYRQTLRGKLGPPADDTVDDWKGQLVEITFPIEPF